MSNPICDTFFRTDELKDYFESETEEILSEWAKYCKEEKPQEVELGDIVLDDIDEVDFFDDGFVSCTSKDLEEYEELKQFVEEIECDHCMEDAYTIIHEYHTEEYCRDDCENMGYISSDFPHWIEIDWETTKDNWLSDYTSYEYQSETYYIRS